jgi:hypothetical protein
MTLAASARPAGYPAHPKGDVVLRDGPVVRAPSR